MRPPCGKFRWRKILKLSISPPGCFSRAAILICEPMQAIRNGDLSDRRRRAPAEPDPRNALSRQEHFKTRCGASAVVVRGPKPAAVMREWGVPIAVTVPEPNTWREVLKATEGRPERRIAVQEFGRTSAELIEGLRARGAEVTPVPVYQWDLPLDQGPLKEAIQEVGPRRVRRDPADHLGSDGASAARGMRTPAWRVKYGEPWRGWWSLRSGRPPVRHCASWESSRISNRRIRRWDSC